MEIIDEKILFKKPFSIQEAIIKSSGKEFKRQRINRQDASAVLVFNTDTQKIILTRQFRYAVVKKSQEYILEIVAGKIDGHDSPEETAIRETEEEIGYRIHKKNLQLLVSCFPSPGYTSEKYYIYSATVTSSDKVSEGGGLKKENEEIEIVEMEMQAFKRLILNGGIQDAKTCIAGLFAFHQETL